MLMGKFLQFLTELSAHDTIMAGYYRFTFLFTVLFTTYVTSCWLSCIPDPFWKRVYSKRKEFAPLWSKFFPFRVDHFSAGRHNFERIASLERVPNSLNYFIVGFFCLMEHFIFLITSCHLVKVFELVLAKV